MQLHSSIPKNDHRLPQPANQNLAQALLKNQIALKRFIRRSVIQESDVEDIYQKVLLKGLQRQSDNEIQNPLSYGFKMAENMIAEYMRAHQKEPEELEEEPPCEKIDLEQQLEYQQRLKLYQQVLAKMPKQRRDIFVRRKFNDQSLTEIATALSMTKEAVKKNISRAMLELKDAVQRNLDYNASFDPNINTNSRKSS